MNETFIDNNKIDRKAIIINYYQERRAQIKCRALKQSDLLIKPYYQRKIKKSGPSASAIRKFQQVRSCISIFFRSHVRLNELPEFEPNPKFFKPIPTPTHIDDWLAQYAPEIQSFDGWRKFAGRRKLLTTTKKTIYLLPIGTFDDKAPSLDALAEYCNAFYTPFVTKPLPKLDLEKKGSKYCLKTADGDVPITWRKCHRYYDEETEDTHKQFKVADLLTYLVDHIPEDGICLVSTSNRHFYSPC